MSALLTLNLIVLIVAAWLSLVVLIPDCATSLFRYRLWRLRDRLTDEIRRGEFVEDGPARRLKEATEASIEHASEFSFANGLLMRVSARDLSLENPLDLSDAHPRDRAILEERLEEFVQAVFLKSALGSPSGWLALIVVIPLAMVYALFNRSSDPADHGPLSRERQAASFAPLTQASEDSESLAQHV